MMMTTELILLESIKISLDAINDSFENKKQEIKEIETALEELEKVVVEKLPNQDPDKILKFISEKVDLKLKIEDLKLKKGSSFWHLIKSWTPFIAPIIASLLTLAGVFLGSNLSQNDANYQSSSISFEEQLIIDAFKIEPEEAKILTLEKLLASGIIVNFEAMVSNYISTDFEISENQQLLEETLINVTKVDTSNGN